MPSFCPAIHFLFVAPSFTSLAFEVYKHILLPCVLTHVYSRILPCVWRPQHHSYGHRNRHARTHTDGWINRLTDRLKTQSDRQTAQEGHEMRTTWIERQDSPFLLLPFPCHFLLANFAFFDVSVCSCTIVFSKQQYLVTWPAYFVWMEVRSESLCVSAAAPQYAPGIIHSLQY